MPNDVFFLIEGLGFSDHSKVPCAYVRTQTHAYFRCLYSCTRQDAVSIAFLKAQLSSNLNVYNGIHFSGLPVHLGRMHTFVCSVLPCWHACLELAKMYNRRACPWCRAAGKHKRMPCYYVKCLKNNVGMYAHHSTGAISDILERDAYTVIKTHLHRRMVDTIQMNVLYDIPRKRYVYTCDLLIGCRVGGKNKWFFYCAEHFWKKIIKFTPLFGCWWKTNV